MSRRYKIVYTTPDMFGELKKQTVYCAVFDLGNGVMRFVTSEMNPITAAISNMAQVYSQLALIAGMLANNRLHSVQITDDGLIT